MIHPTLNWSLTMSRTHTMIAAAVASAAFAAPAAAQQPRALPAPDATFEEPFSSISGLRELSNGRVLIADARDKVLALVDLAAQSSMPIGREGSGPGEYGLPMRLFAAPNDTSYLYDPLNQRYLLVTADGKAIDQFRVELDGEPTTGDTPQRRPVGEAGRGAPARPAGAGRPGGPGGVRFGFSMPSASDAKGRLYFESAATTRNEQGVPVPADSAALTRWDRRTKAVDTLAWVRLAKANVQVSGSANNQRVMVGGANPLAPRDAWVVFPDGRVAVVRAEPYRVDMIQPNGSMMRGQPIKYTPIKFTEADRKEEEALRNRARQNSMMVTMSIGPGGTQRSAQMGPGANAPPLEPLTDWPEVKPAFRPGMNAAWARPDGELWIRRMEPAGAKGTLYDVFNAQGALTHQVRVPEGWNVVGVGRGTVYTTKADEDDLLYLQRHRM